MQIVFLDGKNIVLIPLSKEDNLEDYTKWLNNQETTLFMGSGKFPMSVDTLKDYIDKYNNMNDRMLLGVFLKSPRKHIGQITLQCVDWRNRHAEIGVFVGDKEERGKGYATQAVCLIAEHAFSRLNLRKLYTAMIKGNEVSKRVFEKVGFKVEGVSREHFYLNGEYLDCYRLGLLKNEFKVNSKG